MQAWIGQGLVVLALDDTDIGAIGNLWLLRDGKSVFFQESTSERLAMFR